ncbi:3962_t:CDS:10 [Funneliformis mosseae]|uniref:3962_t:CDS:1 n=1 Tax=Funneliformis mosseae TaxID=27381 RepID=A0A9N9CBM8_FUNMO|nr:3962_t:CDS:10 [Funneliformis mosseae]
MQPENPNPDPQLQKEINSDSNEDSPNVAPCSTSISASSTISTAASSTLAHMDESNGTGDNAENQDIGNIVENQEEREAEKQLDKWISPNSPQEDSEDDDTNSEEVLMTGVAPSHEQKIIEVKEPLSPTLKRKQRMDEILQHEDGESELEDEQMTDIDQEPDQESASAPVPEGLCVECRDQEASFFCEQCNEDFCEVCFSMIHRTGSRRIHTCKTLKKNVKMNGTVAAATNTSNGDMDIEESTPEEDEQIDGPKSTNIISSGSTSFGDWIEERARYIPLQAALNVSEYTDKIDIITYSSKARRIVHQIKDLCSILSGLVVASDYKRGQELIVNKSFEENEEFFQKIFEIGRRHKIMNPEKMRDAYGKLMYMLMDSVIPEVKDMLDFSLIIPIKTVYNFLEERDGLNVLHHDLIMDATKEIIAGGKSRSQINQEIRAKERAIEVISRKYKNNKLAQEEIRQCLYSIGDNHAYLRANRDCCDRMLQFLQTNFSPNKIEQGYSLAIISGRNGARLSHSHETQYCYANQTLQLWREIQHEMFKLWSLADKDLLSEDNQYRLRDTGQGLNRVQMCPAVSKVMHSILHRAQQKAGYWVGNNIAPVIAKNSGLRNYIEKSFGNVEELKKSIFTDFFRYAFDGSGADNFFDAGSCIDGRLTSAWNWCSLIEKKAYFPVFLLTGFVGFDGDGF